MKCGLNNYWWQYPQRLVCEGSIKVPENIHQRNGYGFWAVCDGNITIDLSINHYDDGELQVNFWCDKCGNGYYPERNLPTNQDELQTWINQILNNA